MAKLELTALEEGLLLFIRDAMYLPDVPIALRRWGWRLVVVQTRPTRLQVLIVGRGTNADDIADAVVDALSGGAPLSDLGDLFPDCGRADCALHEHAAGRIPSVYPVGSRNESQTETPATTPSDQAL
jgi:hypothetical protein